jgi:hypothetical protein
MCKTVLTATFAAAAAFLIAALTAPDDMTPWQLHALWAGVVAIGVLFSLTALWCLVGVARKHLGAVQVREWRCTYWPMEKQMEVKIWFDDRLAAQKYRLGCSVRVNGETIPLSNPRLGDTYLGPGGMTKGPPFMVEFRADDVALDAPESGAVSIAIKPQNPWGGNSNGNQDYRNPDY